MKTNDKTQQLIKDWMTNPRWKGVKRTYTAQEVVRLQELYADEIRVVKPSAEKVNKLNVHKFTADSNTTFNNLLVKEIKVNSNKSVNTFNLVQPLISSGVFAICLNDDKIALKKAIHNLVDIRFAADVLKAKTTIIAKIKVKQNSKKLHTEATMLNTIFQEVNNLERGISRALSLAPFVDVICIENSKLNLNQLSRFAEIIQAKFPNKKLVYSCLNADELEIEELLKMGYKSQLINTSDDFLSLKDLKVDARNYFDAV